MCGFAGFHAPRGFPADAGALAKAMGNRLRHRGPDDSGEWTNPALGTALAFRRLSIVDLSEFGHQPMTSADGRFVLVLNGEVYNHQALRAELEQKGYSFRGHSDTEVLLAGISTWGLEATLKRCAGMFALAVVDVRERHLQLARDRLGEKPLYYGWSGGQFFFGSELKAFRPHPGFAPEVDRRALTLYLRLAYVPSPWCILAGFHKLLPGHILSLPLDGSACPGKETLRPYWTVPRPEENGVFRGSPEDCVRQLEELLRRSIRLQMLADVPVGAFLSGGIDSSTVVSLMQAQASVPVRTFSIGFPDAHVDESSHAEKVARHLGTKHVTWRCSDSELLALANQISQVYCEPFADDSQLPTMALARVARQEVTVCLSGDGGDELFHGYGHYETGLRRWQQMNRYPPLRTTARCGIGAASALVSLLIESPFKRRWKSRLGKARNQWLAKSLPCYYRHRMSLHKTPDLYLSRPEIAKDFFDETSQMTGLRDDVSWLSYLDLNTYLPDDILVKVDRAAMAFSLETRIPLLDHRVVEYAIQIPDAIKRRNGRAKWPLRAILERSVPPELTERPKMGFCTPMGRWLRGPLFEWAESQLGADRLRREGFFDPREVRQLWLRHQQGPRDGGLLLWGLLMFQAWFETF
jgi:asparagine synthase (glutamine-hydrolysing)